MKGDNVCDICQDPRRKVTRYRVIRPHAGGNPTRSRDADLCFEHAEPLKQILSLEKRIVSRADRTKVKKVRRP